MLVPTITAADIHPPLHGLLNASVPSLLSSSKYSLFITKFLIAFLTTTIDQRHYRVYVYLLALLCTMNFSNRRGLFEMGHMGTW